MNRPLGRFYVIIATHGTRITPRVRINRDYFSELKRKFIRAAAFFSHADLYRAFLTLPSEPYAPVQNQLRGLLRAVNRSRTLAGLEPVTREALRLRRSPVRPFEGDENEKSPGSFDNPPTTESCD